MDSNIVDSFNLKNNFIRVLFFHSLNGLRNKLFGNTAAAVSLDDRKHGNIATRPALPMTTEVTDNRTYQLIIIKRLHNEKKKRLAIVLCRKSIDEMGGTYHNAKIRVLVNKVDKDVE